MHRNHPTPKPKTLAFTRENVGLGFVRLGRVRGEGRERSRLECKEWRRRRSSRGKAHSPARRPRHNMIASFPQTPFFLFIFSFFLFLSPIHADTKVTLSTTGDMSGREGAAQETTKKAQLSFRTPNSQSSTHPGGNELFSGF